MTKLNKKQKDILNYLKNNKWCKATDIKDSVGISHSYTNRLLNDLEDKQKVIKLRVGRSYTWKLNEKRNNTEISRYLQHLSSLKRINTDKIRKLENMVTKKGLMSKLADKWQQERSHSEVNPFKEYYYTDNINEQELIQWVKIEI